ncbi:MAG: hypothetical protein JXD23_16670 [Spirochaetales bacterium]|nr:hypothetical protein [Spirochaetales bacterium]
MTRCLLFGFLNISLLLLGCNAIIPRNSAISGTPIWAKSTIGGNVDSEFQAIAATYDGFYTAGKVKKGLLQFGNNVTINGQQTMNSLLIKYNKQGSPVWGSSPVMAECYSTFHDIAVAGDSVFAVGFITPGQIDFGNSISPTGEYSGTINALIVKYSSTGMPIWANSISSNILESDFQSVAIGTDGVYAAGYLYGNDPVDFGNSVIIDVNDNCYHGLIVKYSFTGIAQWAKSIEADRNSGFLSLAFDENSVFVSGYLDGKNIADFGNSVILSGPSTSGNPIIVKYSNSGITQWARTTEYCSGTIFLYSIDVENGAIYAAGQIYGTDTVRFLPGVVLTNLYNGSCLIVKYDTKGMALWARTCTFTTSPSKFQDIAVEGDYIIACGTINYYSTFFFGNGVYAEGLNDSNPIIISYDDNGVAQWAQSTIYPTDSNVIFNKVSISCNNIFIAGVIYSNRDIYFDENLYTKGSSTTNPVLTCYQK